MLTPTPETTRWNEVSWQFPCEVESQTVKWNLGWEKCGVDLPHLGEVGIRYVDHAAAESPMLGWPENLGSRSAQKGTDAAELLRRGFDEFLNRRIFGKAPSHPTRRFPEWRELGEPSSRSGGRIQNNQPSRANACSKSSIKSLASSRPIFNRIRRLPYKRTVRRSPKQGTTRLVTPPQL